MSEKDKKKIAKKLKVIVNESNSTSSSANTKRYKALLWYISHETKTNIAHTFLNQYKAIYSIFLESFSQLETLNKKGKKVQEKDIRELLHVLRLFLNYCRDILQTGIQFGSLRSVCEKLLYVENHHSIRYFGFELYMMLLDIVYTPEKEADLEKKWELIPHSLDFRCFSDTRSIQLPYDLHSVFEKSQLILPSLAPPTCRETTEILEIYFSFIRCSQNFPFWFRLTKEHIFSFFYPSSTDHGIPGECPAELQLVVLKHVSLWIYDKTDSSANCVMGDESRLDLLLNMFRQALKLPCTDPNQVHFVNDCIEFWLMRFLPSISDCDEPLNKFDPIVRRRVQTQFMSYFPTTFEQRPGTESHTIAISRFFLQQLKTLSKRLANFEPQIKDSFLLALLKMTTVLLSLQRTKVSPTTVEALQADTFDVVLCSWIASKEKSEDMWGKFQTALESLLHLVGVIQEIRLKFIHLSLSMIQKCYPISKEQEERFEKESDKNPIPISCLDNRPLLLSSVKKDSFLSEIEFDEATIFSLWHSFFNIFSRINKIKDPGVYDASMKCLCDILFLFLEAENDFDVNISPSSKSRQLHLPSVFGPLLFEACTLENKRMDGKCRAYTALGRLLCKRYPHTPLKLLAHFYNTIQVGLVDANPQVITSIIDSVFNIYSINLPGAQILIPHFLGSIRLFLLGENAPSVARHIFHKCVSLLCSLIFFPHQFSTVSHTLEDDLFSLFLDFVSANNLDVEGRSMSIWALTTILYAKPSPSYAFTKPLIECWRHILVSKDNELLVRSTLNSISLLAERGKTLPDNTVDAIFSSVIAPVLSESTIQPILSEYFYALLDWVTQVPKIFTEEKFSNLRGKLFLMIEHGIQFSGNKLQLDLQDKNISEDGTTNKKKSSNIFRKSISEKSRPLFDLDPSSETKNLASDPSADRIFAAADTLLSHIMQFTFNFPTPAGVDVFSSHITEQDDQADQNHGTYWVFNNNTILSLVEIPDDQCASGNYSRLFIRNTTGKFSWDFHDHYVKNNQTNEIINLFDYIHIDQTAGKFKERKLSDDDNITLFLESLSKNHPEFKSLVPSLTNPRLSLKPEFVNQLECTEKDIATLKQLEEKFENSNDKKASIIKSKVPDWCIKGCSRTHKSRLLLFHLNFLNPLNPSLPYKLRRMENSGKLTRMLAQVDKTPGREVHKVGLLYVSEGQEDQKDILKNERASPLYSDVIAGVGWNVPVRDHRGYLGGLDKNETTGEYALYFANSQAEITFHEIVLMPSSDVDNQQILKKRHVGNDYVHVIWSEHFRDYNPHTITSQFNEAHIIIYPLSNGLFRVQIYRKPKVSNFGPLQHGMVISKQLLPLFLRQTALNACRTVNKQYNPEEYIRPSLNRLRLLKETIERYKLDFDYRDIVSSTLTPSKDYIPDVINLDLIQSTQN